MLSVALDIDNIMHIVDNGEFEAIVPEHMTPAKERRHVIRYSTYIFQRDVNINGHIVTKTLQLKCEVRGTTEVCKEYPYSIKEL